MKIKREDYLFVTALPLQTKVMMAATQLSLSKKIIEMDRQNCSSS